MHQRYFSLQTSTCASGHGKTFSVRRRTFRQCVVTIRFHFRSRRNSQTIECISISSLLVQQQHSDASPCSVDENAFPPFVNTQASVLRCQVVMNVTVVEGRGTSLDTLCLKRLLRCMQYKPLEVSVAVVALFLFRQARPCATQSNAFERQIEISLRRERHRHVHFI